MLVKYLSYLALILLFFLHSPASSRIYNNDISLTTFRRNAGWQFLDRMNVEAGTLSIEFKADLRSK